MATCWRSGRQLLVADGSGLPWSLDSVRQMSCTRTEFRRVLETAFGSAVSSTSNGLLLTDANVSLHFALSEQKPLQIAALRLSTLRVEISVLAGDDTAARQLLARVDRATLRGGG